MKNIDITNAAMKMPNDSAKPIDESSRLPPSISDANVPARITPGRRDGRAGVPTACAAASCGVLPSRASSRSRAIIKML